MLLQSKATNMTAERFGLPSFWSGVRRAAIAPCRLVGERRLENMITFAKISESSGTGIRGRSKLEWFCKMTAVGFEPTQLALVELESTPLDHSGKVS